MAIEIVRRKFAQEKVRPNRLTKLEARGSGTKTGWKSANEEEGLVTRKRCFHGELGKRTSTVGLMMVMMVMLIPMMWRHRLRKKIEPRQFLRNPVGGWGWRRYLSAKVVGDSTTARVISTNRKLFLWFVVRCERTPRLGNSDDVARNRPSIPLHKSCFNSTATIDDYTFIWFIQISPRNNLHPNGLHRAWWTQTKPRAFCFFVLWHWLFVLFRATEKCAIP